MIVGAGGIGLILHIIKIYTLEADIELLACDTLVYTNLSQDGLIVDARDIDLILQTMITHATDAKFNYLYV